MLIKSNRACDNCIKNDVCMHKKHYDDLKQQIATIEQDFLNPFYIDVRCNSWSPNNKTTTSFLDSYGIYGK